MKKKKNKLEIRLKLWYLPTTVATTTMEVALLKKKKGTSSFSRCVNNFEQNAEQILAPLFLSRLSVRERLNYFPFKVKNIKKEITSQRPSSRVVCRLLIFRPTWPTISPRPSITSQSNFSSFVWLICYLIFQMLLLPCRLDKPLP